MNNCIFCKIIQKNIPADIVFENDDIVAFKDIHPIAPVHILLIPKKHIASINDLSEQDTNLIGKMIMEAKNLAKKLDIAEDGYKLLFRVGENGGQEVSHIHLHLIGGAKLYEEIHSA
ncbi:MAG: Histidine triad protein [uncultured bacterium]|nr:MAG: Histidine triad protein [uncultured bacterium]HBR72012.1 histidine triad nucleotide-binding protein [Candidatus Moranbacteria bacterium]